MSGHDIAGALVQVVNDTYQYNSWWIYVLAGAAAFGFMVNVWIGLGVIIKWLGLVISIKRPGRVKRTTQEEDVNEVFDKGKTKKQKVKKEKTDPLDKLI